MSTPAASAAPRAQSAGRGLLLITAAKIWFMVGGAAIGFVLPHLLQSKAKFGDWVFTVGVISLANNVIITATIQAVAKFASRGNEWIEGTKRSALRLGDSFRRDVHAAQEAVAGEEAGGDGVLLKLELAGGQAIEYRQTADGVERLWFVDGVIQAREPFLFPAETRFQVSRESPQLLVLSAIPLADLAESENRPLPSYTVPVILRVQAVVGRFAGFVDAKEEQR